MNYKAVLFDLDGTLTDSRPGIVRSVQHALEKSGIYEFDLDKLVPFIGPPLTVSFREVYGMSQAEAEQAVVYYREYFSVKGMYENSVYPGIAELLAALKAQGVYLAVATSKPTFFSTQIIAHFGLDQYFNKIVGSHMDGSHSGKAEIIGEILADIPQIAPAHIAMIGDRKFDIEGAQAHNIVAIAAGYGYGAAAEIEAAQPTYVASSVEALRVLLMGS